MTMSEKEEMLFEKEGELGESFSDLMKKVVEQELEEGSDTEATAIEESTEEIAIENFDTMDEDNLDGFVVKSEIAPEAAAVEAPVFEWKESPKPVVENYQPVSEVGVISSKTTINGTVSSKGHIRVEGAVVGDVFAYGDIKITGKVAGDIEGGNIEFGHCIVEGDVKGRGDIIVEKDSTLTGNLSGQLITVDGKVRGNIDAAKGAHLSSTSLVKGAVSTPTLSMSAGAELQGRVSVASEETE